MKPEKYFFLLLHCFNVSLISSDKAHHTSLEFEECEMAISTCQLLTSKAYYCESSCAFNSHFGNVFLEKPVVQFACGKWWLYIHGLFGFLHGITCTHLIFFFFWKAITHTISGSSKLAFLDAILLHWLIHIGDELHSHNFTNNLEMSFINLNFTLVCK